MIEALKQKLGEEAARLQYELNVTLPNEIRKAVEMGDLRFAYRVATNAHFALALDGMLQEIVFAALAQGDVGLARKCASRMHFAQSADHARRQIIKWIELKAKTQSK